METTYLTKEQYLFERKYWREDYIPLAKEIRDYKIAAREMSKGGYSAARRFQSIKDKLGNRAHSMMDHLDNLKLSAKLSVAFDRFRKTQNLG